MTQGLDAAAVPKPAPVLSVVIPAYNEEKRLPRTLVETLSYLHAQNYTSELLVVDDGSRDGTAAVVRKFEQESSLVRLVRSETNHGKGASVRRGVLHSRGEYVLFMDADLATSLDAVATVLGELTSGNADVVIGSRKDASSQVAQSLPRQVLSFGFSWSRKLLTNLRFEDTQCGFKGFRGAAARAIFSESRLNGWSFDVEVLMIAERQGWRAKEIPVNWRDVDGSKVTSFTPVKMFLDLVRLRRDFRSRRHQRLPTALAVSVRRPSGEPELRFASNLSSGGVFVVMEDPPAVGTPMHVSIALPSGDVLSLESRVAHSSSAARGVGLEFVQLDSAQRDAIVQLLKRLEHR